MKKMKKYVLICVLGVFVFGALGVAINAHNDERVRIKYSKCATTSTIDAICRHKSRQDFSKIRRAS